MVQDRRRAGVELVDAAVLRLQGTLFDLPDYPDDPDYSEARDGAGGSAGSSVRSARQVADLLAAAGREREVVGELVECVARLADVQAAQDALARLSPETLQAAMRHRRRLRLVEGSDR